MQRKKVTDRRFRSGEAAKLVGMPTATLRIWEQRYAAISPQTSTSGQRLFSDLDIERLRLLRCLVQRGHAIRSVAKMNNSALLALLESSPWREREKDIEGAGPTNGSIASITPNLQPSGETVDGAGEPFKAMGRNECGATDSALMIHVTQLNEGVVRRIVAIAREMGAVATVIAYQSAKHAAIQHAKRQDIQLVPTPDDGIAWASTLLDFVRMAHEWRHRAKVAQVREKRRFDDAQIASIAQMPTKIACECPKHVAELIRQLTAFERYSDDCQSRTPTDALLHRRLGDVANRATSIFEAALADVIEHEGWN